MLLNRKKHRTIDSEKAPEPPYYLTCEDLFVKTDDREIFIKRIFSTADDLPAYGPVIMAPGISTNANLFRLDDRGEHLRLDHNRSFANLLASEGFDVYLYHPGYAERVRNRYVCRHCPDSIYYNTRYRAAEQFSYGDLINVEVPAVIDFVHKRCRTKNISWVGYSLGGMLAYSYLSKNPGNPIKQLVTIGSPMAMNQIVLRFIPFINVMSQMLGFEEDALFGNISKNLVPLTRTIRALPNWFVRFNLITPYLCNPLNLQSTTFKTMLGQIIEPMPKRLQKFFSQFMQRGYSSQEKYTKYLDRLRRLKRSRKHFLFFYGNADLIATPESVFLAREMISPHDPENLIGVSTAGHIDLIVGKNAPDQVWQPTLQWLKAQQAVAAGTTQNADRWSA